MVKLQLAKTVHEQLLSIIQNMLDEKLSIEEGYDKILKELNHLKERDFETWMVVSFEVQSALSSLFRERIAHLQK